MFFKTRKATIKRKSQNEQTANPTFIPKQYVNNQASPKSKKEKIGDGIRMAMASLMYSGAADV